MAIAEGDPRSRVVCKGQRGVGRCSNAPKYVVSGWPACGVHLAQIIKYLLNTKTDGYVVEVTKWRTRVPTLKPKW